MLRLEPLPEPLPQLLRCRRLHFRFGDVTSALCRALWLPRRKSQRGIVGNEAKGAVRGELWVTRRKCIAPITFMGPVQTSLNQFGKLFPLIAPVTPVRPQSLSFAVHCGYRGNNLSFTEAEVFWFCFYFWWDLL